MRMRGTCIGRTGWQKKMLLQTATLLRKVLHRQTGSRRFFALQNNCLHLFLHLLDYNFPIIMCCAAISLLKRQYFLTLNIFLNNDFLESKFKRHLPITRRLLHPCCNPSVSWTCPSLLESPSSWSSLSPSLALSLISDVVVFLIKL